MNASNHLLFICSLIILISSCQNRPADNTLRLSGQITNPVESEFSLSNKKDKYSISLNEQGSFDTLITISDAGKYQIRHGRETSYCYLTPGTETSFTINTKDFDESINYAGNSADISNFYAAKYLQRESTSLNPQELYSLEENDFLISLEQQKKGNLEFLSARSTQLPAAIVDEEKETIEYERLLRMADYELAHQYFTKDNDFKASPDFNSLLNQVELDDESKFKSNEVYARLVSSIVVNMDIESALERVSKIESSIIKESILQNLKYEIKPGAEKLDFIYKQLIANTEDENFKTELTVAYEKCKVLAPGLPSPTFDYMDRNGQKIKLEDLKGKNVYVDVWATWCAPCLAEVPSLKELEKTYREKNIEFVSISIDQQKDKAKWLQMIESKELKGIQLMADKDWKSEFVSNYNITGIPRFILIDKYGKIVSPDAPRPSAGEEISTLLDKLVKI